MLDPNYFGTREVAEDQMLGHPNIRTIIPAQVKPAIWRAIWMYEMLGLEVVVPPRIPKMIFQPNLKEPRWRVAWKAYLYEFSVRIYYLLMGYI